MIINLCCRENVQLPNLPTKVHATTTKGQLILKQNCRVITSPKKQTNEFGFSILTTLKYLKLSISTRLDNFCFEIYWPLVPNSVVKHECVCYKLLSPFYYKTGTMGRIGSTSYVLPIRLSYRTLNRVIRVLIKINLELQNSKLNFKNM